jgi:hypothetical protein
LISGLKILIVPVRPAGDDDGHKPITGLVHLKFVEIGLLRECAKVALVMRSRPRLIFSSKAARSFMAFC